MIHSISYRSYVVDTYAKSGRALVEAGVDVKETGLSVLSLRAAYWLNCLKLSQFFNTAELLIHNLVAGSYV
jgi:hypothetical protein